VVGAPQLPVPVQRGIAAKVDPVQDAAPHGTAVAACWQAPAPLQAPVLPQGGLAGHWPAGAVWPAARFAQLPAPLMLQAWQRGQLALPQQTPSVQNPLMHWLPAVQARPFGLRAQLPPWQVFGATQSASPMQVVRQAVGPHT
jgi:hypothetical protein